MPRAQELLYHRRADEPRATCDEHSHVDQPRADDARREWARVRKYCLIVQRAAGVTRPSRLRLAQRRRETDAIGPQATPARPHARRFYDLLPASHNAGEQRSPRLTALDELGFPGEDAWADQPFCGGLGGRTCASSVREKLLLDPF
ncbi:MAG: hypothetical protein H6713_13805 [Myxococcales bacterium]|nr:hypothetical protein [Myxococcales bacterium]